MKREKEKLSSPHLKILQNDLEKIEKSEKYLESERVKLIKEKEKVRGKIKKEKEILNLKNKLKRIKSKRI